ncbi:RNA polymerase sigma factor RpoD/SigA [Paenibacillus sp. FSL R5-0749]|uniref:sigma-70 family RNA polymerase sigma factor n=1 Tax=Paenibacillus sp. FSL R5-0749 TaxID=2921657 RepID=UPI00315B2682
MSLSINELIIQLNWFEIVFPVKRPILLSKAKKKIEESLNISIQSNTVHEFLLLKEYRSIQIDIALSPTDCSSNLENTSYDTDSKKSGDDDLSIEDILSMSLMPSSPVTDIKKEPNQKSYFKDNFNFYTENLNLIKIFHQTANIQALEQLIYINQKLVLKMVSKYKNYMMHDLSEGDLISEGNIGLLKAINRFDHNKETQFSTYAVHWIKQSIIRAIMSKGTNVRIPVHFLEKIISLKRLETKKSFDGTLEMVNNICSELGISIDKYYMLKLAEHRFLNLMSINSPVGGEGQETEILEFLPNDRLELLSEVPLEYNDPALVFEKKIVSKNILGLLEYLDERQKNILILRFGLNDDFPKTLEEIGLVYNLTRERIRQIESKALKRLHKIAIKAKISF